MRNLTEGNIHKSFLSYSLPVILSTVLSNSFGIINSSIAGLFLGARGIAATGATADFFTVINSIVWGYNMGFAVYVARVFAAGKYKHMKKVINTNFKFIFIIGAIFSSLSIIFNKQVLTFLKVDPEILGDAKIYFFIISLTMCISLSNSLLHNCVNAMGDTSFPLIFSLISSIINVTGNIVSVVFLDMGVLGLGLSVLFSSSISFIAYVLKMRQYYKRLGVGKYKFKPRVIYVTKLFSYTLPVVCQQVSLYITGLFMAPIKNGLGYMSVAVLSLTNRINDINIMVYQASTKAGGQYIAQCVGAKKYHMIKKAVGVTLIHSCLIFLPLLIAIWCAPEFVCSIFIDVEEEAQILYYVTIYIKYFMPFVLFSVVTSAYHSIARGLKSTGHLLASSLVGAISRLVISYFFVKWYGVIGMFIGTAAAPLVEIIYVAVVYKTGFWLPKDIRPHVLNSKKSKSNEMVINK